MLKAFSLPFGKKFSTYLNALVSQRFWLKTLQHFNLYWFKQNIDLYRFQFETSKSSFFHWKAGQWTKENSWLFRLGGRRFAQCWLVRFGRWAWRSRHLERNFWRRPGIAENRNLIRGRISLQCDIEDHRDDNTQTTSFAVIAQRHSFSREYFVANIWNISCKTCRKPRQFQWNC